MRKLSALLTLTTIVHSTFAAAVVVHSRLTDRNAGIWLPLTLVFGLGGVVGSLLTR